MRLFHCATACLLFIGAVAQVPRWTALPLLNGDADDRARLGHLLGHTGSERFLLRGTSDALDSLPGPPGRLRWALFAPDVSSVYNSSLPFSLNDGALWAGRGWSEEFRTGVRAQWGHFSLVLAPELVATENLSYDLPPPEVQLPRPPGRNPLSTPCGSAHGARGASIPDSQHSPATSERWSSDCPPRTNGGALGSETPSC